MNEHIFIDLKEVGEDGTFKGIASVMDVEDLGGDIIDKGGFTKTLQENPKVPVLWQHDPSEVIGIGEVKEFNGKVYIDGKLDMTDPIAVKAHGKMKNKLIKGLSVGFQTIKSTWEKIGDRHVRHIGELKLFEVSVVTFAMNPGAQIIAVKSQEAIDERFKALESQISALTAELSTVKAAGTGEPAAKEPTEPVVDHSAALSIIDSLRARMIA